MDVEVFLVVWWCSRSSRNEEFPEYKKSDTSQYLHFDSPHIVQIHTDDHSWLENSVINELSCRFHCRQGGSFLQ